MKPSAALILFFTVAGITSSCKKDINPNEGTKLLRVESAYKNGDFNSRTFRRNASDHLVAFRDSSKNGIYETVAMEYGADGRLSKVKFFGQLPGVVLFHFEFEYNNDGRISKRQEVPGTINLAPDYHTYTYDASGHLLVDSQFQKGGPPPQTYYIAKVNKFIYTGDNVTEAELYHTVGGPGPLQLEQKRKYDYDNKINPYKVFPYLYFINEGNSALETIVCVSAGNVVKEYAAPDSMVYEIVQIYKYQYNSSGYPWKVKHEIDHSNQGLQEGEYFYQ